MTRAGRPDGIALASPADAPPGAATPWPQAVRRTAQHVPKQRPTMFPTPSAALAATLRVTDSTAALFQTDDALVCAMRG